MARREAIDNRRWLSAAVLVVVALALLLAGASATQAGPFDNGQPPPGTKAPFSATPYDVGAQPENPNPDLSGEPTLVSALEERVAGGDGSAKPGGREDTGGISGADLAGGRSD